MTTVATLSKPPSQEELAPYRAISRSAVVSVALTLISLPLVVMAMVAAFSGFGDSIQVGLVGGALAIPALILGWSGWRAVRRYPTEYTGGRLARFGLLGGLVLMIAGFSVSAISYATEKPEGYDRVSFYDLQPDPEHPELPFAPLALELSGKPIFIKGYMHPGVASNGRVDHFILIKDFGQCCFGGTPKPTHMISVHVPSEKQRPYFSRRTMRLSGKFLLSQPTDALGMPGVMFHLEADQVR